MKRNLKKAVLLLAMVAAVPTVGVAQDEVETSVGADIVSGYIWRGQDLGGVSIQPSLGVAYKGFSLSAWGSVGIDSNDTKEFDLTLGFASGGFSISLTDYWFANQAEGAVNKYFEYAAHKTAHVLEAQIGYDFGVLSLNWYTNLAGADGVNEDGDRAYSSYIAASVPFKLGGLDWSFDLGATPWATSFYGDADGFAVCDVSLGASKEIKITDSFSVPAFAKATWNPATEGAYFVFGLSF